MIIISFIKNNDLGIIRINGINLSYGMIIQGQPQFSPINKFRFDYNGIIKEFPELRDVPEPKAREIAEQRLKERLSNMKSEEEVYQYILNELRMHGCIPMLKQKAGFRPEKIK